jgi:hypothetical protein
MTGFKSAPPLLVVLFLLLAGCPAGLDIGNGTDFPGGQTDSPDAGTNEPAIEQPAVNDNSAVAGATTAQLRGEVRSFGEYRLFDIGTAQRGDQLTIAVNDPFTTAGSFILAVFDENNDLVMRSIVGVGQPLTHHVRDFTSKLMIGVTPLSGSGGGPFQFRAERRPGGEPRAGTPQLVYLNFNGAANVRVHNRAAVSFGPFLASNIAVRFTGLTPQIRERITAVVREDYAPYQVTVVSSDDGPPPDEAHTTIHFGGNDSNLLGLADSVDLYNSLPVQSAIVYTDAFSAYEMMNLDAEELGLMIGNVASHELGHLLGLYHTKNPADVMDTTGSAWDLAGDQAFSRAALEPSVFPWGNENSPRLLEHAVGRREDFVAAGRPTVASSTKLERVMLMREITQIALRHGCGTCQHLDE